MVISKNAVVGIVAAAAAAIMLVAGLGVTATSGAGTDFVPPDYPLEAPAGNPPASPVEPPSSGPTGDPIGVTDPTGNQAGAGADPAALPNAGRGTDRGAGANVLLVLAALSAVTAAGATVRLVAKHRG